MRPSTLSLICAFFLLIGAGSGWAQALPDALPDRVERWRGDLAFLAGELPRLHKDLFFQLQPEAFQAEVDRIHEQIPDLQDHEIVVAPMSLVAMVLPVSLHFTDFETGSDPVLQAVMRELTAFQTSLSEGLRGAVPRTPINDENRAWVVGLAPFTQSPVLSTQSCRSWRRLMEKMLLAVLVIVMIAALAAAAQAQTRPVAVIFDTDMGSDCDDAGALALLHALADRGEVELLATIFSSRGDVGDNRYGPGVIDAINTYYGRPDLPIGANKGSDVGDPNAVKYPKPVGANTAKYGHDVVGTDDVPDMIDLYRRTLAARPDRSVTILTVGHPIALYHLLRSVPDDHSPLGGRELVVQKVERWVAMGPQWNFNGAGMIDYIEAILEEWPVDAYVSPAGETVLTGRRLPGTPENNPVREVYALYLGGPGRSRSSWDQIASLFAVCGTQAGFQITGHGRWIREGNEVEWDPGTDHPRHYRVDPTISDEALAETIEDLMTRPPDHRNRRGG